MTKISFLKIAFLLKITLLVGVFNAKAQLADTLEAKGYFTKLAVSNFGIVASDNYCNSLYLLNDNSEKIIFESPGCGRYFEISNDGNKILFKYISDAGQQPAVLNLSDLSVQYLHTPVDLCGQPTMSQNGQIAYTIGSILFVENMSEVLKFDLKNYANQAPISPDGLYVAYNSADEKLMRIDLKTRNTDIVSANNRACIYPQWSPDSKKILYMTIGGEIHVFNSENNKTTSFGIGANPAWNPNSDQIIFEKRTDDDFMFSKSQIVVAQIDNTVTTILNTEEINFPMNVIFLNSNKIVFHNFAEATIFSAEISNSKLQSVNILHQKTTPFIKKPSNIYNEKKNDLIYIDDIPYIHQVYEVPDFHDGRGSCAPTTALMAIAFYNRLPEWDFQITNFDSIYTRPWGSYVADKYRYRETFYDWYGANRNGWGGYGYMWHSASPSSMMRSYIEKHDIISEQLWLSDCGYNYICNEINAGFPLPICSWITTSGHLTLARGHFGEQHSIVFNDPYGDKNTPGYPSYDGLNAIYDWAGYNNGYQNIDPAGHGGVAWTVSAQAEQKQYNDSIIDDLDFKHGFYMHNSSPAHMQWYRDALSGYQNHHWWTNSVSNKTDICYVTWAANITESTKYNIFAYIPETNAEADVSYKIFTENNIYKTEIAQGRNKASWVFLGAYNFTENENAYVRLGDSCTTAGQKIAFDAVKWEKAPTTGFAAAKQNVCENEAVKFFNYAKNALSWKWEITGAANFDSDNFEPTFNFHSAGLYNVKMIAYYDNHNDTTYIENYLNVCAPPVADFFAETTELTWPESTVVFTNNSLNANNFSWTFNNQTTSTEENPTHIFAGTGIFDVELIAGNLGCASDTLLLPNYISINAAAGIVENVNEESVSIFPNPASLFFVVQIKNAVLNDVYLEIISTTGNVLFAKKINHNTNRDFSYQINIADIPVNAGFYYLKIHTADRISTHKLIIQK